MSYKTIVDAIRYAADQVKGDGVFVNGREVDFTLDSIAGKYPQIYLYPFQYYDPAPDKVLGQSTIMIGFYMQDRVDTSPDEREVIIDKMDQLCTKFLNVLASKYKQFGIDRPFREPQYQEYSGTASGVAVKFNYLTFDVCA